MSQTIKQQKADSSHLVGVFKALGDPVRLEIMQRMVAVEELPCTDLDDALTITKSTISHHMRTLHQAGLVEIRKEGRNYFYTARVEEMDALIPGLVDQLGRPGLSD